MNPGGAIKDRMALYIPSTKAGARGYYQTGGATIVEKYTPAIPAWASRSAGGGEGISRCIFTMPDKMSAEKVNALESARRRRWW